MVLGGISSIFDGREGIFWGKMWKISLFMSLFAHLSNFVYVHLRYLCIVNLINTEDYGYR
jgi:hypothetical protein